MGALGGGGVSCKAAHHALCAKSAVFDPQKGNAIRFELSFMEGRGEERSKGSKGRRGGGGGEGGRREGGTSPCPADLKVSFLATTH